MKCANLFVPLSSAGMAELADAADSKSAEVHPSWGFNSPSRHQTFEFIFNDLAVSVFLTERPSSRVLAETITGDLVTDRRK